MSITKAKKGAKIIKKRIIAGVKALNIMRFLMKKFSFHTHLKSKREFIVLRTCILQISIGRV